MFHHFHGKKFKKSPGSINQIQFKRIIHFIKKNYNLLNAEQFIYKASKKNLHSRDVCLTFDDNLRCQFDIALPVLKKEKLSAFFFIYTSTFDQKFNLMEVTRDFINSKFRNFDEFFNFFEKIFFKKYSKEFFLFKKKFNRDYLVDYSFYSLKERKYRFIRDRILNIKKFENLLLFMMEKKKYKAHIISKKLFMNENQLRKLIKNKNHIGLHSHYHYPNLELVTPKNQIKDYKKNYQMIKKKFGVTPVSASYPFGRYNSIILDTLKKLKIKVAFLSKPQKGNSYYKIGRIDHVNILNKL